MNKTDLIKQELAKTVGYLNYNGWSNRTAFGYHSYNIEDINIEGQRNPKIRLEKYSDYIDFDNKVVVDFGCNVGAMLHHIKNIKIGIGFDFDQKCIDAAKNIAAILAQKNLDFFTHNFDKDDYSFLKNKIVVNPDVIFLLSLGSWVKSWRDLYSLCCDYNCTVVLEINNSEEGAAQLKFFEEKGLKPELIIDNSLDDFTGNNRRKTYIIKTKDDKNHSQRRPG